MSTKIKNHISRTYIRSIRLKFKRITLLAKLEMNVDWLTIVLSKNTFKCKKVIDIFRVLKIQKRSTNFVFVMSILPKSEPMNAVIKTKMLFL